jgi:hypothetical protein
MRELRNAYRISVMKREEKDNLLELGVDGDFITFVFKNMRSGALWLRIWSTGEIIM